MIDLEAAARSVQIEVKATVDPGQSRPPAFTSFPRPWVGEPRSSLRPSSLL
jgi:hypothetical protein